MFLSRLMNIKYCFSLNILFEIISLEWTCEGMLVSAHILQEMLGIGLGPWYLDCVWVQWKGIECSMTMPASLGNYILIFILFYRFQCFVELSFRPNPRILLFRQSMIIRQIVVKISATSLSLNFLGCCWYFTFLRQITSSVHFLGISNPLAFASS